MRPELKIAIQGNLSSYSREVQEKMQGLVRRSTYRASADAKRNAPSKFGHLRRSITEKISRLTGEIAVNVDYAGAVEFGSRPHVIRPKRKKALAFKPGAGFRFWDESGRVVVKSVKHPGTRAQPFLTPAIEREAGKFQQGAKNIIENQGR